MSNGENAISDFMFPHLHQDYKLLQFPSYGILVSKTDGGTCLVNKDGVTVLSLCDGKKQILEITEILTKRIGSYKDFSEALSRVKLFIGNAVGRGHLLLLNEPMEIKIDKRGSLDYYLPAHLVVELTNSCNLNCRHCYRSKQRARFIETTSLLNLLKTLSNETLLGVEFTGGEPTLHPDFGDIVIFAANVFQMVGVLTNGTRLARNTIEKLSDFKNKVAFSVSLDSYDPSYHDSFRGVFGSWGKTTENIKLFVKSGFVVRVAMSVTPENVGHMDKTAEWCLNNGVKVFSYSPVLPFGNAKENNYNWTSKDIWELYETEKKG